jgi:hypothetical protein
MRKSIVIALVAAAPAATAYNPPRYQSEPGDGGPDADYRTYEPHHRRATSLLTPPAPDVRLATCRGSASSMESRSTCIGTKASTRGRTSMRATAVKWLRSHWVARSSPGRYRHELRRWATLHSAELEANWARARREESLEAIEPLP